MLKTGSHPPPKRLLARTRESSIAKLTHQLERRAAQLFGSMRRVCTLAVLSIVAGCLADNARACSCGQPDLTDLYRASAYVALAEVTRLQVEPGAAIGNSAFVCVATLRTVESFKALRDRELQVRYPVDDRSKCGEAAVPPPRAEQPREIIVGGCDPELELSEQYVIFVPDGGSITVDSMCDPSIHYGWRIRMDFMRRLRDGANPSIEADAQGLTPLSAPQVKR